MKPTGKVDKYVRFEHAGTIAYGIRENDRVKGLEGDIFDDHALTGREYPLSQTRLLVPCQPSKVLAVGLNYADHAWPFPPSPSSSIKPLPTSSGRMTTLKYRAAPKKWITR